MMTIRDRIKRLVEIDNLDRIVVLSSDREGNSFRTAEKNEMTISAYHPDDGEVGLEKLTSYLESRGYTEEDVLEDGVPALVLY